MLITAVAECDDERNESLQIAMQRVSSMVLVCPRESHATRSRNRAAAAREFGIDTTTLLRWIKSLNVHPSRHDDQQSSGAYH
jgi:transposase-like protein